MLTDTVHRFGAPRGLPMRCRTRGAKRMDIAKAEARDGEGGPRQLPPSRSSAPFIIQPCYTFVFPKACEGTISS